MTTWAVVTTTNGSFVNTVRFVAYYLSLGASRIYLYLDNPEAEARTLSHPKLDITVCDQDYWQKVHGKKMRPKDHQPIQRTNARHAYSRAQADWLLHVDLDEYLIEPSDKTIMEVLESFSKDVNWIRTFEPLNTDSENALLCFRPKEQADLSRFVNERYRKSLLLEHDIGKCFVRLGLDDVKMCVHTALMPDPHDRVGVCYELGILHVLNFGALGWAQKYVNKIARGRLHKFGLKPEDIHRGNKKIAFYYEILDTFERDGIDGLIELFQGAKNLSEEQIIAIYPFVEFYEFEYDFGEAIRQNLGLDLGEMNATSTINFLG